MAAKAGNAEFVVDSHDMGFVFRIEGERVCRAYLHTGSTTNAFVCMKNRAEADERAGEGAHRIRNCA